MAKQVSLIKLEGNVGDLSFFKSKTTGFQARMKTGVSVGGAQQYGRRLRGAN